VRLKKTQLKAYERDYHTFISDIIETLSDAKWRVKKTEVKAYKRD
jgi:pyrroloquinoline quinone (PQQ) biosynthesis protein C